MAFENLDTLSGKNCANDSSKPHQDEPFQNNLFKDAFKISHTSKVKVNEIKTNSIEKQLTQGQNLLRLEKHVNILLC